MNEELRHNLRRRWLFSLFEFAHLEFQRRLWIEADYPNSIGDFTEAVCQYFDDLHLENRYDYFLQQNVIDQSEFDIIIDFHDQLEKFVKKTNRLNLSDNEVLLDSAWIKLTNLAKTNWDQLKTVIIDRDELDYMSNLENEYLKS